MEDKIVKLEKALWEVWNYLDELPCYPDDLRETIMEAPELD